MKNSFVIALGVAWAFASQAETNVAFQKIQLSDQFWAEGASFGDFNHDGKMDVVAGPFWWEGPTFARRHTYRSASASFAGTNAQGGVERIDGFEGALGVKNSYSDDFLTFVYDFNQDGWPDVLVIGFPGEAAHWFENPKGGDSLWKSHEITGAVDNESPAFVDINGDGKPEIVCNHDGYFGYYAADWARPEKPWTFHPISPKGNWGKFTHGLGVGDINGDGRMDVIEKEGWWEQPPSLAGDPIWKFHPFPFAPGPGTAGAAQMYTYDVNGDGWNDVITCLNPHGYGIVWYEQTRTNAEISFIQHAITGRTDSDNPTGAHFTQPHAMALADVDGDGLLDIVTGKRFWAHGKNGPDPESGGFPAVLYWFQLKRGPGGKVDYIPHLIDNNSGVGTEVTYGSLGEQGRGIVVANKKGVFVFEQRGGR